MPEVAKIIHPEIEECYTEAYRELCLCRTCSVYDYNVGMNCPKYSCHDCTKGDCAKTKCSSYSKQEIIYGQPMIHPKG